MPTLTFKATAEEARAIREAALREKLNLSAYLRRSALRVGGKPAANPRLVRSPRTGAYVVAAPRGAPTLTSAKSVSYSPIFREIPARCERAARAADRRARASRAGRSVGRNAQRTG